MTNKKSKINICTLVPIYSALWILTILIYFYIKFKIPSIPNETIFCYTDVKYDVIGGAIVNYFMFSLITVLLFKCIKSKKIRIVINIVIILYLTLLGCLVFIDKINKGIIEVITDTHLYTYEKQYSYDDISNIDLDYWVSTSNTSGVKGYHSIIVLTFNDGNKMGIVDLKNQEKYTYYILDKAKYAKFNIDKEFFKADKRHISEIYGEYTDKIFELLQNKYNDAF